VLLQEHMENYCICTKGDYSFVIWMSNYCYNIIFKQRVCIW